MCFIFVDRDFKDKLYTFKLKISTTEGFKILSFHIRKIRAGCVGIKDQNFNEGSHLISHISS